MLTNINARLRIVLLVIAAALPMLAVSLYGIVAQRQAAEAAALDEMRLIAELTAQRPEQMIQGARQWLSTMAVNIDALLASRGACNDYFNRLAPQLDGLFHSAGVILPDGELYCDSALAESWVRVTAGDQPVFRTAIATGQFTVGEFRVGRTAGKPGIDFAYPVPGAGRQVRAVVYAALNLEKFAELGEFQRTGTSSRSANRLVTIYDRNGIVLAQYPEVRYRIGEKGQNPRVLERLSSAYHGVFTDIDQKRVQRLYATEYVGRNADGIAPLRVVVSMPTAVIFAEANRALMRTGIGIVLISVLVVAGAWYGAEVLLLRKVRSLLDMAHRVRHGDFSARAGLGDGREEMAQLGRAFDGMVEELQQRDLRLKQVLQQLNAQAVSDQLTGLPNRRFLWDALEAELMRGRRKQSPLAVMMLDIDYFKEFNDRRGHEAGDLVLKNVASVLRTVVRGSDIVARHGGEKFVIVLPEATEETARARAEALRAEIAALRLTYGGEALEPVTLSVGIAVSADSHESGEALVRAADDAMYEAKRAGRDRIVIRNA